MGDSPQQSDLASHAEVQSDGPSSREASTPRASRQHPLRTTSIDSSLVDQNVIVLLRAGAALVIFFQLIYTAEHAYGSPSTFGASLSLHLANVAIGVLFLLASYTGLMPRFWREISLFSCAGVLIFSTAISLQSEQIEPLFVSVLVVLVGAATLAPWDWRWQTAINVIGLACYSFGVSVHPGPNEYASMRWLGLMTAFALAHSNVYLQTRNRREIAQNLADRLEKDRELRESESTLRQIFDASLDAICLVDPSEDKFLMVNEPFVRSVGLGREQILATRASLLGQWMDPERQAQFSMQLQANGAVKDFEAAYGVPNGQTVQILISAVMASLGNRQTVLTFIRDVTPLKQAEQRLRESEEKFRQIFQQSGDMVVVIDLDTHVILEVNNQFVLRSRVPRERVLGHRESEFKFFADPAKREQFFTELRKTGMVKNLEVELEGVGYAQPMIALISAVKVELQNQTCAIIVVREISDIKEAERKLRNSEATLRKIFDANLDSVTTTDAFTRRYTDANYEFTRATGFSREEVLGKAFWEVGVWPSREEADAFSAAMARDGEVRNMRANFYAKDGTQIPCLMSGAMVELDGKLSVLTITRNIGDLLAAEQKLKESEASLRKIFNSILDPLSITDVSGRFIDVNDEFLRLGGFSREEVIGWAPPGITEDRDVGTKSEYGTSLRESGQARNFEMVLQTKRGIEIPLLLSSVVVELGGKTRIVTIARDITTLKEQERKLQSSEAMLREIFDSSVDNIALTDFHDHRIIDVNNELLRSLGLAKEEIIGRRFDQLGVWEDIERLDLFAAAILERREVRNFETTFRSASGSSFPALVSAVVLELDGRECVLSIARDITDLEAARQKALAASKAKTEFLSSMSHEIRTPMNAILGMADLIGESDLNSEQRRYLETIISNGNALLELINSILDLARVESGRMNLEAVAFDVVELTEKVADTLAVRAHEKGIELAVRLSGDLPPKLVGDSLRLRQVLTNLVGNAIKFTERGEVVIEVAPNPGQANPGSLLFAVRDSGIGMPREMLPNIFSAFTQADSSTTRKYGGSGLGLTIVERLVALMGGKVWVESELGVGSTFYFTVELGGPAAADQEGEDRAHRPHDLAGIRALLVDDSASNRSIVSQMLRGMGAAITEAESGAKGLELFVAANRRGAPFELLLADLDMPGMDGFEMIRQIRLGPDGNAPTVLFVTSKSLTTRLQAMRDLNLSYYVVKPIKKRELYGAICEARAHTAAPAGATPAPPQEPPPNGSAHLLDRPLSILLADDSPDNRLLIAAYLKKSGYVLDEVEDGQAAVDHFMTRAYDLVLMDIQMPVLDGYSAVRLIRQWETANQRRKTPIIALTASALEGDVRRAAQVGCDLHVSKPVRKSTLLKAIASMVENAAVHDDSPSATKADLARDGTTAPE